MNDKKTTLLERIELMRRRKTPIRKKKKNTMRSVVVLPANCKA